MNRKDDFIDSIFREGFRDEEQFTPEISEAKFDESFDLPEKAARNNMPFSWLRFSAAASFFLAVLGCSWYFLRPLQRMPLAFSGGTVVKKSAATTDKSEKTSARKTPGLITQLVPKPKETKTHQKETKPVKAGPEKPELKLRTKNRNRKKRIGATLFPGIFPPPLFAEKKQAHSDSAIATIVLPLESGDEKLLDSPDAPQDDAIVAANEIESVEFHPEGPLENPVELLPEKPIKQKRSVLSVLAAARQIRLSKLPSVEEAKGLLFSGIGRLVGMNQEPASNKTEENSNSEL